MQPSSEVDRAEQHVYCLTFSPARSISGSVQVVSKSPCPTADFPGEQSTPVVDTLLSLLHTSDLLRLFTSVTFHHAAFLTWFVPSRSFRDVNHIAPSDHVLSRKEVRLKVGSRESKGLKGLFGFCPCSEVALCPNCWISNGLGHVSPLERSNTRDHSLRDLISGYLWVFINAHHTLR